MVPGHLWCGWVSFVPRLPSLTFGRFTNLVFVAVVPGMPFLLVVLFLAVLRKLFLRAGGWGKPSSSGTLVSVTEFILVGPRGHGL